MGPLAERAGTGDLSAVLHEYENLLMDALRRQATPSRHINVLEHLLGFLKNDLANREKQELLGRMEDYRLGRVPLVTPLALLSRHLKHVRNDWVDAQYYLEPYPAELALRSII